MRRFGFMTVSVLLSLGWGGSTGLAQQPEVPGREVAPPPQLSTERVTQHQNALFQRHAAIRQLEHAVEAAEQPAHQKIMGDIVFNGNYWYWREVDYDTVFVMFEARNSGSSARPFVEASFEILNVYGSVIATDSSYVHGSNMTLVLSDLETDTCLRPGEVGFFGTYVDVSPSSMSTARFYFDYDTYSVATPDARVEVSAGPYRSDWLDYVKLTGTLRNNGTSDANFCGVSCALKASDGHILDVNFTFVDGASVGGTDTGLLRGGSGTFEMYTFAPYTSYSVSTCKTFWNDYGTAATCTYSISPTSAAYGSSGGSGVVSVTTQSGCAWTATEGLSWVTITSGQSGTGSGTVAYSVSPNTTGSSRTGTITIAGRNFTVTQSAQQTCTFSISPTSASFGDSGGNGVIGVVTQAGCAWSVSESLTWVAIDSGASGTGPGNVIYAVSSNQTPSPRTGNMTVAGQVFTINQDAHSVGNCIADEDTVCLQGGRFKVEVGWRDAQGRSGRAKKVAVDSTDSALLWFFSAQNWEMMVKVLDGCGINGHYWVFGAASTNVEYHLEVTDTVNMTVRSYDNPMGTFPVALGDTSAFATCP